MWQLNVAICSVFPYTLKTAGLFYLLSRGVMKCFTHYGLYISDMEAHTDTAFLFALGLLPN